MPRYIIPYRRLIGLKSEEIIQTELAMAHRRYRLFSVKSFPRYVWHSVRESNFYRRARLLWISFRRYRLISRMITVISAILAVMGTGAAMLVFLVIALLFLPIATLLAGGTVLLGLFQRKKQNELLRKEVEDRTVYLFFPSTIRTHSFFAYTARQLAQHPHSVVFIISPYSWSPRGVGGKAFYINARREDEHLFLLRRHYFFFFRQLLVNHKDKRTVVIL